MKRRFACFDNDIFKEIKHIVSLKAADDRGSLVKMYSKVFFESYGVEFETKETIIISSKKNVLRGIHYQRIKEVDKLIMCQSGKVFFVAVDLRKNSELFGKYCVCTLNLGDEIYIPKGFGIATLALEDSELLCLYGEIYYEEYATGIVWNDSEIGIKWPINEVIVSDKDKKLLSFKEYVDVYSLNDSRDIKV